MSTLKILGLAGSLRKDSFNRKLLVEADRLAPAGVELAIHDYSDVPLYNADTDEPAAVLALKNAIAAADAVLIATPEYNYSIPGVLKNAVDWSSRPGYQSVWAGKPVAVIGAAPGMIGTARAQGHLKQVLLAMVANVFPFPEFALSKVKDKMDDGGRLHDDFTVELLTKLMAQFADWARRFG